MILCLRPLPWWTPDVYKRQSHNPAKYNGYKAYGPDGCQMTDEAADIVLSLIHI